VERDSSREGEGEGEREVAGDNTAGGAVAGEAASENECEATMGG
jgi:hypothetical protein